MGGPHSGGSLHSFDDEANGMRQAVLAANRPLPLESVRTVAQLVADAQAQAVQVLDLRS
jgi:hypothetical protein